MAMLGGHSVYMCMSFIDDSHGQLLHDVWWGKQYIDQLIIHVPDIRPCYVTLQKGHPGMKEKKRSNINNYLSWFYEWNVIIMAPCCDMDRVRVKQLSPS